MSNGNCLIYFYVDSESRIRINHLNNTADEIVEFEGYRDDYPMLLFAYCYKTRRLFVTNINDEMLEILLESLKSKKSGVGVSSTEKDAVAQLETASSFLKSKYAWKGEIFSGESLESAVLEKATKDFKLAWQYLQLVFGGMKLDPIDLPVYVVNSLAVRSIFVPIDEELDIGETITGPAIVLRKTNSLYFMSEALIYQYILNLHGIVDFAPGIEETYLKDAKEFVDRTLSSFLRNSDLREHTFWYIGKKDARLYLNENEYVRTGGELLSQEGYSSVVTFEYAVVEDSRYVIFNDITAGNVNDSELYKSMLEFLGSNLSYIGHIDEKGEALEDPPIYLFEGLKPRFTTLSASNLPIWILIQTVLAALNDFDPQDILIVRGAFNESFAFRYIDPLDSDDKEILSEYLSPTDYNMPIIMWNTASYDSIVGKWNQFINQYLRFIGGGSFEIDSIEEELKKFRDNVLEDPQNRLVLESAIGLLCEENPHMHQYNVFSLFSKVVGLTGIVTENMLEEADDFGDDQVMALLTDIQTKLFFLTIKTMAQFCNIKHGTDFYTEGEIEKGSIVADLRCQCLLEVEAVLLEPENQSSENPEGVTYACRNLICDSREVYRMGEVKLFHLGFLDEGEYNEKQASKIKKEAQQLGKEYYKRMLERFLRNRKRSNPLDYDDPEDADPPSFEAFLRMQGREFGRSEGEVILENMLNNCRKVKNYGE